MDLFHEVIFGCGKDFLYAWGQATIFYMAAALTWDVCAVFEIDVL